MSQMAILGGCRSGGDSFVSLDSLESRVRATPRLEQRDATKRELYLKAALAEIPRILGALDRNPFRPTYGCLDRAFWHYRTSDFASAMHQEALWPLALVLHHDLPGNRWHNNPALKDLVVAGLRFSARSSHRDGACDDYYPYEQALGAAVFSTNAAAQSYLLLDLDDRELRDWFTRRADWLAAHEESGRLTNHQALAAVALLRAGQITGRAEHREAAQRKLGSVLAWQHAEGWFDEYSGADPGYQTVTLDCLADYQRLAGAGWLDPAISRALTFARACLHPDGSYGGVYGSRGTRHFYPHGMELLANRFAAAADLADGFLNALAGGRNACFADDRMYAHYVGNLIEAWLDWSPERPATTAGPTERDFPAAGLYIRAASDEARDLTVLSTARGGSFVHFDDDGRATSDAGLVIEFDGGKTAVAQLHDCKRTVERKDVPATGGELIRCAGQLHYAKSETMSPWKLVLFRVALLLVGRWSRGLTRRLLQRRLITGRRPAPARLTRSFEFDANRRLVRVTDEIELLGRARVRRMALGVDHESAYVAATGVYQDQSLARWTDLSEHVEKLNSQRRVAIVRELLAFPRHVVTARNGVDPRASGLARNQLF